MLISKAFPQAGKVFPAVDGKRSAFEAISLLRKNDLEALPVTTSRGTIPEAAKPTRLSHAITGYSVVSWLAEKNSKSEFLEEPCERVALPIGSVFPDVDLVSLLQVFETSTFGLALLENREERSSRQESRIISLKDLLVLYTKGTIATALSARELASSPVFSLSANSNVENYLREAVRRKFRRILLDKTNEVITDRLVIDLLLKKTRAAVKREEQIRVFFETKLQELDKKRAATVGSREKAKEIAELLLEQETGCVLTETGIITPWDLVMKPWRSRNLKIQE